MTIAQEDILYDFLDEQNEPFSIANVVENIVKIDSTGKSRLAEEVRTFIEKRRLAFPLPDRTFQSRRGYFDKALFIIRPTRLEIQNGILIPGHRCIPFGNPILFPHEYHFLWKGTPIPMTHTEGAPEEFYPYYSLYGEEYAPQYVARDNPENEAAFNADPYEDPGEVSITTVDLRSFYRETSFVPGNKLVVQVTDWKAGTFAILDVLREPGTKEQVAEWSRLLEEGFFSTFKQIGPGTSTEEQLTYAFWYGGRGLFISPMMSVEEFIYEYTESIDTVAFGMETRFWFAGKEIPDQGTWTPDGAPPDKTELEEMLYTYGLAVSEFVIQSYVRDALYQQDNTLASLLGRIVPAPIRMNQEDELFLAQYVMEVFDEFSKGYSIFLDKEMGPIRHGAAELHTAVVALGRQLSGEGVDISWLPKHTLVILSQLQVHSAHLLEDLDIDEPPAASELEAMDNALEGMLETYEDLKTKVQEAVNGFRRSRISVLRPEHIAVSKQLWRAVQFAISGTSLWRRLVVPDSLTLWDLHLIILALFGWSGQRMHGFILDGEMYDAEGTSQERDEHTLTLGEAIEKGITEFIYNYDFNAEWEIRISLLHVVDDADKGRGIRCTAGEGAAPPEHIGGPLRFHRFISALRMGNPTEQAQARKELGEDFDPDQFDLSTCNNRLLSLSLHIQKE